MKNYIVTEIHLPTKLLRFGLLKYFDPHELHFHIPDFCYDCATVTSNQLVRVTTSTSAKRSHLPVRLPTGDQVDNAYASNIQIAELNALNAMLAVIKWKKLSGFYQDSDQEFHSVYSVNLSEIINEDQGPTPQLR